MQPKTFKSKNNGCGTAPGNLVNTYYQTSGMVLKENIKKNYSKYKQHFCIFKVETKYKYISRKSAKS